VRLIYQWLKILDEDMVLKSIRGLGRLALCRSRRFPKFPTRTWISSPWSVV